jgi:Ni/Fe-hydrogenase subunit HybB-like protein
MARPAWLPRMTFWRVVFLLVTAAGLYATIVRIFFGLGASTNLSDQFPWGLWIGFDVLSRVGLAAGGFTLAAIVYIFNIKRFRPIIRAAVLTAFLSYLGVIVALLFELGRPDRVWHPLVMWSPNSVMFEVAWCVTLYATVLMFEFSPAVLEKLGWTRALRVVRAAMIPLVIAGVLLSTLHQASLGTLYVIVPHKLHALWYTPLLPVFFFVSALAAGLAMTIFASWHSGKAFGRQLEMPLLRELGRVLAVLLAAYLAMRFLDLARRGALPLLLQPGTESRMFALETALLLLPALLLFRPHVLASPKALYACAVLVMLGVIANRLNVSVTGMETGSGTHYVPKWTEAAISLATVAWGFAGFYLAAKYLPVFEKVEHEQAAPALARGG